MRYIYNVGRTHDYLQTPLQVHMGVCAYVWVYVEELCMGPPRTSNGSE